jgi:hypothetical protein
VAPSADVAGQGRTLRSAFVSAVVSLVATFAVIGLLLVSAVLIVIHVPTPVGLLLSIAAAVFLATWATGTFYQASLPALVDDQIHTHSPLVPGLVLAGYMAPSVFGASSPAGSHQRRPNASP